ncbi:MAG: MarR family transcriptional regulator [Bacteroidetes bacterium HGW-Bacteroidetes-1]|jgi:DNA-binding MarR family transcriptional regulator|nr:MAG: MarR family transcriptional regulator [Bacteroidetes bacterium HGW-Bacteroidetes-1]
MDFTDILINIRKIVRSVNLESKRIEKDFGISIPQLLCLHFLALKPDYQSTVTGIASYLNLNLSTATGIVSRLEKKNLVARLPRSGDKRISVISITTTGLNILEKSPQLMHQQLSKKLSSLPEKQLLSISNSLELLVQCFDLTDEQASPLITIDDFNSSSDTTG